MGTTIAGLEGVIAGESEICYIDGYLGVLSYPSGNVADVAAVVTALALAVPRPARPVVVVAGAVAVGMMTVAVVGLRWHYPTDALAGAVLGVGTVLTVDGAVHLRPSRPAPHPQR